MIFLITNLKLKIQHTTFVGIKGIMKNEDIIGSSIDFKYSSVEDVCREMEISNIDFFIS